MKFRFLFSVLFATAFMSAQNVGTVAGQVTDGDLGDLPLPYASVAVKGTSIGTSTDQDGKYSLTLSEGKHLLVFSFVGYESIEQEIQIIPKETVVHNVKLSSGSVGLEGVVVTSAVNREREATLLLEQKKAVEIKQSIGTQEMQRKGVTTVEQGVTKISGVSRVADRGIFIRGLDDRYNYLQINGLNFIPSDPNLKTIPLSYIPTDVVRNIDVYKTFNTSLYQDFAGASINVMTKDISSKPFTKVSISAGFNSITTFKDFKSGGNGFSEFSGYSGDQRNLPGVFDQDKKAGYTATPSESKELFNSSWTPERTTAPLSTGLSITNSDTYTLSNDRKIGYILNMNFNNNFLSQTGQRRNLNSEGTAVKDFELASWKYLTQKSALASVNYKKTDRYNFFFNVLYFQNSESTIEEIQGENTDFITIDRPFFMRDTKYVENSSLGLQHYGTINIDGTRKILEYGVAVTMGKNDTPDRKTLITEGTGADADYVTFNGVDPFRFYSVLDNFNVNGKIDYEYRFGEDENDEPKHIIRVGYAGDLTNFDFFNRTIRVNGGANLTDTTIDTNNPQQFFDANFDAGNLFYVSTPDPTYKVAIKQFINGGFANYTRRLNNFTFDLGVRAEYLFRETQYRLESNSVTSPYQIKEYTPFDISPVVNVKYSPSDRTNWRFTASKTSTKPRFREILPFRYQEGDGSFTVGNPDIINTTNYNVDFKYEYFPNQRSVFSAALFGKLIEDPITRLQTATSTGFLTYYDNFSEATLFGLELEAGFPLDLLFTENPVAQRTSLGLNAILMKSNESAPADKFPAITSTDRSLQGASDFIINADLTFELINSEKTESRVSVIYNSFTNRIYAVGNSGAADISQRPIDMLDFTWRNTFSKKYQINLSVKNILNKEILATQDPTGTIADPDRFSNVNSRLTQGVNVGLEFSYIF